MEFAKTRIMKRISLIVYKTIHEFGYTHVSVHVQGEPVEWCYVSTNGVQSNRSNSFSLTCGNASTPCPSGSPKTT